MEESSFPEFKDSGGFLQYLTSMNGAVYTMTKEYKRCFFSFQVWFCYEMLSYIYVHLFLIKEMS